MSIMLKFKIHIKPEIKMKEKNEFSLIIIGNVHSDFTLAPSLRRLFAKLHRAKISSAFLEEGPSDETLQSAKESTLRGIKQTSILKRLVPELLTFYETCKSGKLVFQHLRKTDLPAIKDIVKTKILPMINMSPQDEGMAEQITLEFFRENAYKEEIKLYENLAQLNIPYAGIDLPSEIYGETLKAGSANPDKFVQNESIRMEALVRNTFNNMNQLPNGGFILITTGETHAHRLAAKILLGHQKNEFNTEHCVINIHPFSLSSFCVEDWKENHYGLEITRKADSSEILDMYKILPCKEVYSKQEGDGFSIPAIEALVNDFILSHSATKSKVSNQSIFNSSLNDYKLVNDAKELESSYGPFRSGYKFPY